MLPGAPDARTGSGDPRSPDEALIVLISRGGQFIVPRGATPVLERDRLLVLTGDDGLAEVKRILQLG